jgi:hypothetical protein
MKMLRVFTLIRVGTEQIYLATRNYPLKIIPSMTIVADTLTGGICSAGYPR